MRYFKVALLLLLFHGTSCCREHWECSKCIRKSCHYIVRGNGNLACVTNAENFPNRKQTVKNAILCQFISTFDENLDLKSAHDPDMIKKFHKKIAPGVPQTLSPLLPPPPPPPQRPSPLPPHSPRSSPLPPPPSHSSQLPLLPPPPPPPRPSALQPPPLQPLPLPPSPPSVYASNYTTKIPIRIPPLLLEDARTHTTQGTRKPWRMPPPPVEVYPLPPASTTTERTKLRLTFVQPPPPIVEYIPSSTTTTQAPMEYIPRLSLSAVEYPLPPTSTTSRGEKELVTLPPPPKPVEVVTRPRSASSGTDETQSTPQPPPSSSVKSNLDKTVVLPPLPNTPLVPVTRVPSMETQAMTTSSLHPTMDHKLERGTRKNTTTELSEMAAQRKLGIKNMYQRDQSELSDEKEIFTRLKFLHACGKDKSNETLLFLYISSLCSIAQLERRIGLESFDDISKGFFLLNPARRFPYTCHAVKYIRRKCRVNSSRTIRPMIEELRYGPPSSLFSNVSSSRKCDKKETKEKPIHRLARSVCIAADLFSDLQRSTRLNNYDLAFGMTNIAYRFQFKCQALYYRKLYCFGKE